MPDTTTPPVPSDDQLREQVEERQRKRAEREQAEANREDRDGPELIKAAAKDGEKLSDGEVINALDWFMSDDSDESYTHEIQINVGPPNKEVWIAWEIKPVDLDTLKRIRKSAQGGTKSEKRRNAASGELDEVEANIRIVVEGTVTPDLREIAANARLVDPADVLRRKFRRKPGLLGQLSGEIMSISGYDDEDVREVDAAGNS
jgi:hypothetical protein